MSIGDVMILPIIGISTNIPSKYDEIIEKLIALGLQPTGNIVVDKARLAQAISKRIKKLEEVKQKEIKEEENKDRRALEMEKIGAEALANLNKAFFNIQ